MALSLVGGRVFLMQKIKGKHPFLEKGVFLLPEKRRENKMSRAELLYYEPFSFSIETMGQMFYLSSPTAVRGKAVSTTGQISFADGHGEQDLPVTNEKVTVEGVMPFHDYDARLADKTQYLQPRILVMVLRALLKHQTVMQVKCPYLAFDEICVIRYQRSPYISYPPRWPVPVPMQNR